MIPYFANFSEDFNSNASKAGFWIIGTIVFVSMLLEYEFRHVVALSPLLADLASNFNFDAQCVIFQEIWSAAALDRSSLAVSLYLISV